VALVAVLLAGGLMTARLADPMGTYACSCRVTGPASFAELADAPGTVVFIGTVQSIDQRNGDQLGHARGVLLVEWVFKGSIPSARMPVVSGGGGDCTMALNAGQRMITAATLEGGEITPHLCSPYGDPATPEGQQLIEAATTFFGAGAAPPGAEGDPTSPDTATPDLRGGDPVLLAIVIATPIIAILLILVVVAAFRRRDDRAEAP
jgi:hypothetical protein